MRNLFLERNCLISANKLYRWSLSYKVSKCPKEIIFIGLNPSLSDEVFLDNTTKKIIKISENLVKRFRLIITTELVGFATKPLFATLMARGVGIG